MTPEAQQIAIAEFCGWTKRRKLDCEPEEWVWNNPDGQLRGQGCIPNYVRDLNAMHEAEKLLDENQKRDYFYRHLCPTSLQGKALGHRYAAMATAAQRAEAFLRTINKWTE